MAKANVNIEATQFTARAHQGMPDTLRPSIVREAFRTPSVH